MGHVSMAPGERERQAAPAKWGPTPPQLLGAARHTGLQLPRARAHLLARQRLELRARVVQRHAVRLGVRGDVGRVEPHVCQRVLEVRVRALSVGASTTIPGFQR